MLYFLHNINQEQLDYINWSPFFIYHRKDDTAYDPLRGFGCCNCKLPIFNNIAPFNVPPFIHCFVLTCYLCNFRSSIATDYYPMVDILPLKTILI